MEYQKTNIERLVRSNYDNLFGGKGNDYIEDTLYGGMENSTAQVVSFLERSETRFNILSKGNEQRNGIKGLGINFLGEATEDVEDKMEWKVEQRQKEKINFIESEVIQVKRTSEVDESKENNEELVDSKLTKNFDSFRNSNIKNEYMLSSPVDSRFDEYHSDYKEDKVSLPSIAYSIGQSPSELSQRKSEEILERSDDHQTSENNSRRSSVLRRKKKKKDQQMEFTLGNDLKNAPMLEGSLLKDSDQRTENEESEMEEIDNEEKEATKKHEQLEINKDDEELNVIVFPEEHLNTKEMNNRIREYELEMNQLALQISRGGSSFEEEIEDKSQNKNIFFEGKVKINSN
jgi:hypothetical protein